MSTAFRNGVAAPRSPSPTCSPTVVAFGRTLGGIPFGAADNQPTDLFFLVLCRDTRTHLHVLARLGRLIQSPGFLDGLRHAPDSRAAYDWIVAADQRIG
jgi:PTS system nitrogen regulatory IIA component